MNPKRSTFKAPSKSQLSLLAAVALFSAGISYFAMQLWNTAVDAQIAETQTVAAEELLTQLHIASALAIHEKTDAQIASSEEPTDSTQANETAQPGNPANTNETAQPGNPANINTGSRSSVIGVLEIPKLGLKRVIAEGTSNKTLNDPHSGVGHYPGTALPGGKGNFAITGHRNGNGGTFFNLDKLKPGDVVKVTTKEGSWNYRVTSTQVVDPSNNKSLMNWPYKSTITITTCHPKWSDKQRLIVVGELIS